MFCDFQSLPQCLRDIVTKMVHLALQVKDANWKPKELWCRHQPCYHAPNQKFIQANEGVKHLVNYLENYKNFAKKIGNR